MTSKIRKKPISAFLRNILIMLRGSVIAQIASLIGGLYLAKLFGPENYGVYGSVISISSIIALGLTLQMDKAIVLSKNDSSKKNWTSFLVTFILFLSIVLAFLFFGFKISINNYSYVFICLSIILSGILSIIWVFEALFTSNKKFKTLANSKIIVSLSIVLFQFLFFKMDISNGLIIGFITAQSILLIYFAILNRNYLGSIHITELKAGFKKHKDIVSFLLPSNIINGIGVHVMPILILAFFDATVAAVFFLAVKLLSLPLHLMTSSIGNVFFEKASNENSVSKIYSTTKKVVLANTLIMFVFLLVVNTLGIWILDYFFDDKWENISLFLMILSFLFLARASFNPISSLIVVKKKNHIGLLFNIYLVSVNLVAIWIGYNHQDITYTLYILSIFGGIGYFSLLYYFGKLLKHAK